MTKRQKNLLVQSLVIIAFIAVMALISTIIIQYGPLKQLKNTNGKEQIVLKKCVDGDTFGALTPSFGEVNIRMSGVNTPELSHPELNIKKEYYGQEAADYTCNRLKNAKVIELEWDQTQNPSHGRPIAIVFIDGQNFNIDLFYNGYANDKYLKNTMPYYTEYKAALLSAKENKRGMWAKN